MARSETSRTRTAHERATAEAIYFKLLSPLSVASGGFLFLGILGAPLGVAASNTSLGMRDCRTFGHWRGFDEFHTGMAEC